jgi:tetratricopeptide (TPR) repeat protein
MHSLARALDEKGRYEHAHELYETCIQRQQLILGSDDHPDDHPDCLETRNILAGILYKEGHYDESQRMNERCLETKIGLLGQGHPSTLVSMLNLVTVLYKQKSYEQARYYF